MLHILSNLNIHEDIRRFELQPCDMWNRSYRSLNTYINNHECSGFRNLVDGIAYSSAGGCYLKLGSTKTNRHTPHVFSSDPFYRIHGQTSAWGIQCTPKTLSAKSPQQTLQCNITHVTYCWTRQVVQVLRLARPLATLGRPTIQQDLFHTICHVNHLPHQGLSLVPRAWQRPTMYQLSHPVWMINIYIEHF